MLFYIQRLRVILLKSSIFIKTFIKTFLMTVWYLFICVVFEAHVFAGNIMY